MGDITATGYLILGLLNGRDFSAYELVEQLSRGVGEVWYRADRQLYETPKRLVERGVIDARKEPAGATRERTVYSINDVGRAALAEWLTTEIQPSRLQFEGMIRLLHADAGTIEDLRESFDHRDGAGRRPSRDLPRVRAVHRRYGGHVSRT